jgi:integrase
VAAIRLLILTGARLREILHAKWEYVDWDRGLMHLPDSKTGKKTIYLPSPALTVLQSLPRRQEPLPHPKFDSAETGRDQRSARIQAQGRSQEALVGDLPCRGASRRSDSRFAPQLCLLGGRRLVRPSHNR